MIMKTEEEIRAVIEELSKIEEEGYQPNGEFIDREDFFQIIDTKETLKWVLGEEDNSIVWKYNKKV